MFVPEKRSKQIGPLGISALRPQAANVRVQLSPAALQQIDGHRARAKLQSGYEPTREDVVARLIETYAATLA